MENTAAAFALFAFFLSLSGIVASLAVYAASYMALSSMDATLSPQFESAESALTGASISFSLAANSSAHAYSALNSLSEAFQSYSDSTSSLSSSLSDISSIPPFSLDARLTSASGDLRQASQQFANASRSASQMASSAQSASASVQSLANDIDTAASKISEAKLNFHSSLSGIGLLSLLFSICLLALFSSVMLVSLSVLLSHYPNMLKRAEESAASQNQAKNP